MLHILPSNAGGASPIADPAICPPRHPPRHHPSSVFLPCASACRWCASATCSPPSCATTTTTPRRRAAPTPSRWATPRWRRGRVQQAQRRWAGTHRGRAGLLAGPGWHMHTRAALRLGGAGCLGRLAAHTCALLPGARRVLLHTPRTQLTSTHAQLRRRPLPPCAQEGGEAGTPEQARGAAAAAATAMVSDLEQQLRQLKDDATRMQDALAQDVSGCAARGDSGLVWACNGRHQAQGPAGPGREGCLLQGGSWLVTLLVPTCRGRAASLATMHMQ